MFWFDEVALIWDYNYELESRFLGEAGAQNPLEHPQQGIERQIEGESEERHGEIQKFKIADWHEGAELNTIQNVHLAARWLQMLQIVLHGNAEIRPQIPHRRRYPQLQHQLISRRHTAKYQHQRLTHYRKLSRKIHLQHPQTQKNLWFLAQRTYQRVEQ